MTLLLEDRTRQPHVLLLTLNRAERANALSKPLLLALEDALHRAADDDSIRCIVITGAGSRAFSAGADISEQTGFSPDAAYAHMRWGQDLFSRLSQLQKPTIAAINGYALGGGLELALACDFRTASESARLGLPEVTLASLPGWGGTQRLTRAVGKAKAMDLILTGRMMDGEEAERAGLVSRLVEDEKVFDTAMEIAQTIAAKSRPVTMVAKETVNSAFETALSQGIVFERRSFQALFSLEDQKEGMDAFANKREAQFKDR